MAEIPKTEFDFYGLDMDTAVSKVGNPKAGSPPGSYIHALNVRLGISRDGKSGNLKNIRGTVQLPWTKPAGTNTCIGAFWDERENTDFCFIWNSLDNHSIIRIFRNVGANGTVEIIMTTPSLNFGRDFLITAHNFLDGEYLCWSDYNNRPRLLDIPKVTEKKPCVRLFFRGLLDGDSFTTRQFDVVITLDNNSLLTQTVHISTLAQMQDMSQVLRDYASNWNSDPNLSQYFTATACGHFIELCAVNDGAYFLFGTWTSQNNLGTQVGSGNQQTTYANSYGPTFTAEQLDRIFRPPALDPTITYLNDPKRQINYLDRTVFQMAVSYIGYDKRRTVLSPYTGIILDGQSVCSPGVGANNCALLDFSDPRLDTLTGLSMIEKVEVFVRFGNDANWKSVRVLDTWEWIYDKTFRFYNDGIYAETDPAYAVKHNDYLPERTKGQDLVIDDDGNNRIIDGGIIESYGNFCPDADVTLDFDDTQTFNSSFRSITGTIYIINPFVANNYGLYQPIHDLKSDHSGSPLGTVVYGGFGNSNVVNGVGSDYQQYLPEGGFVVYLAGTDYRGISQQIVAEYAVNGGVVRPQTVTLANGNVVYDSEKLGAAANILNRTGKAAIRAVIENATGGVYSEFEIPNVPPGEYVLRVASHWVSVGDDLAKGAEHDLNNPRDLWQSTSTYLLSIGGQRIQEYRVTVPTGSGPAIVVPDIQVADLTYPGLLNTKVYAGYLFDNNADSTDTTLRQEGLRMERQEIYFILRQVVLDIITLGMPTGINPTIASIALLREMFLYGKVVTDHNGFFFFTYNPDLPLVGSVRAATVSGSDDPLNPTGSVTLPTGNFGNAATINTTNRLVANDFNGGYYEGDLDTAVALSSGSGNLPHSGTQLFPVIFYNDNQDISDNLRTTVKGKVVTSGGVAVPGVSVVYENTGRTFITDSLGDYAIPIYVDAYDNPLGSNINDRINNLILGSTNNQCAFTFPSGSVINGDIPQFEAGLPFSRLVHRTLANIIAEINSSILSAASALKRGGGYFIGLGYKDSAGWATPVNAVEYLYIPHFTEDLNEYDPNTYPLPGTFNYGIPIVSWRINHPVPNPEVGFFTHYQWFRTKNNVRDIYLQWIVNTVKYVERYDTAGAVAVITSYGSGSANEIYLNIGTNIQLYKEENTDSQVGYLWEEGDRVIILADELQGFYTTVHDFPIRGQSPDLNSIIIENQASLPEFKSGCYIEIYRPHPDLSEKLYYEIPGQCFAITNPETNPTHSVLQGTFTNGDTYFRQRVLKTEDPPATGGIKKYSFRMEDASVSDFFPSLEQSIGRVNAEDPNAEQQHRDTAIRISNPFISGTQRFGANEYEPLNIKILNKDYGLIQKIAKVGEVVLCICSNRRTTSIYMGKTEIKADQSRFLVAIIERTLGTARELQYHAGTLNPESFIQDSGYAYWVDRLTGSVVRYTVNGIHPIEEYKMVSTIRTKCEELNALEGPVRIYATFDRFHKDLIIRFDDYEIEVGGQIITEPGVTYSFHEGGKDSETSRWITEVSGSPGFLIRAEMGYYSFLDGSPWLHHASGNMNRFYGVQYPTTVTIVLNMPEEVEKQALSISFDSHQDGWYVSECKNERGQSSNIPVTFFRRWGTTLKGAFLRDIGTSTPGFPPQDGLELRSRELEITIRNDSTGPVELSGVTVFWIVSQRTSH